MEAVGILGKVVGEIWNPMKAAKMELFVELKARYKQLVFIIAGPCESLYFMSVRERSPCLLASST